MKPFLLCSYLELYPFLADGLRLAFENYIRQDCNESSMNFEWLGVQIRRMTKSEGTWRGGSTSFTEDRFLQVVVVKVRLPEIIFPEGQGAQSASWAHVPLGVD